MNTPQPNFKPHRITHPQRSLWTLVRRVSAPLWDRLCPCELTPAQRRTVGSLLFPGAHEFVSAMAEGMRDEPALFAHMPVSPTDLAAEHDGALDLLFLSHLLRELAQLAYDAYLQQQSSVVAQAQLVIRQVRAEGQQPFLSPEQRSAQRLRELAISAAQKVLTDRQQRIHRAARMNKRRSS